MSGLAAGAALLVRPMDGVAIWGAQAVHALWTTKLRHAGGLALSAAGLVAGGVLYVLYNRVIVGEWLQQPLSLVSSAHRLGFGPDIGMNWDTFDTPGHTPWRAGLNLNFNAAVMSQDLFGWPLSSLLFVAAFCVFGRRRSMYLLSGLAALALAAGYALFWYHGVAFGARFYFCLLPHLVMLTAAGIDRVPALLAERRWGSERRLAAVTWAFVGLSFVFGWTVYVPKVALVGPYHDQRGVNAGLYEFVEARGLTNALVFVRVRRQNLFGPGFAANDVPPWTSPVLYAIDRGEANRWLIDRVPGRSIHHFTDAPEPNPYAERWNRFAARLSWR
jgi:hypothetical protein